MRLYLLLGYTLCMLLLSSVSVADEKQTPVRVGLLPMWTKATLVRRFEPLLKYIERSTGRPVEVQSAPDFKVYIKRAIAGDFDIFLSAPHIAAYMERYYQSHRIARFARNLNGYFVVHKDAPYSQLAELRGRRFVSPDPLAVITILGEQAMMKQGLNPDRDFLRHHTTHNNALRLVARGDHDLAVVGATAFDNLPPEIKQKLRILQTTRTIPHIMFHARSDLAVDEVELLGNALLSFTSDGPGKMFFSKVAYGDMAVISDTDIDEVQGLVEILIRKLNQK